MITAIDVCPRGRVGPSRGIVRLDPRSGSIIKEEPGTIVWRQKLPDGTPVVVKVYRNRHLIWFKSRGLYTSRVGREFRALCQAEDHQVHCSSPVFWAVEKSRFSHIEVLVTREVEEACDLKRYLLNRGDHAGPDLKPLFALVARLHRAGIQHGALLTRNILIQAGEFYLIDFPRSQCCAKSIEGRLAGIFDVKNLVHNLFGFLPDEPIIQGLAGYPCLHTTPAELISSLRRKPLTRHRQRCWRMYFIFHCLFARHRPFGDGGGRVHRPRHPAKSAS